MHSWENERALILSCSFQRSKKKQAWRNKGWANIYVSNWTRTQSFLFLFVRACMCGQIRRGSATPPSQLVFLSQEKKIGLTASHRLAHVEIKKSRVFKKYQYTSYEYSSTRTSCTFCASSEASYRSVTTSIYAPVPHDSAFLIASSNCPQVVTRAENQSLHPSAAGSFV